MSKKTEGGLSAEMLEDALLLQSREGDPERLLWLWCQCKYCRAEREAVRLRLERALETLGGRSRKRVRKGAR